MIELLTPVDAYLKAETYARGEVDALIAGISSGGAASGVGAIAGTTDLVTLMDAHYGAGNWSPRNPSIVGSGTDITPALTAGLNALRTQSATGKGRIYINPGLWMMKTPLADGVLAGNQLEGFGSQASIIVYDCANGAALNFKNTSGYSGGGAKGLGILLESGRGNSSAYGVSCAGTAQYQNDQIAFEDLYISAFGGASYWWTAMMIDGTARSSPQGVRVGHLQNIQLFNSHQLAFWGGNLVQWTGVNIGSYTGIGTGNNIVITSGSTLCKFMHVNCGGSITTSGSTNVGFI